MKISPENRKILTDEFKYSANMMKKTSNPEKKLFYFSSTFGALHRAFNLEYNIQLVFAHFVLLTAHANMLARIQAIKGGDEVISFPDNYF